MSDGTENNGKATRALSMAEVVVERISGLREYMGTRFDRVEEQIASQDARVTTNAAEIADLKTRVAVMKNQVKWIGGLAFGGGAVAGNADVLIKLVGG